MAEFRLNPVTGDWVIVAPQREARPDHTNSSPGPERPSGCPFCPGNEEQTPPAILEIPRRDGLGWQVRVFANLYPALLPQQGNGGVNGLPNRPAGRTPARRTPARRTPPGRTPPGRTPAGMFPVRPGIGAHEVLVEVPEHDRAPADFTVAEMQAVLAAYRARFRALGGEPGIAYVLPFKNHGASAGATLEHPHSQIVASSLLPDGARRERHIARREAARHGHCTLCRMVWAELDAEDRIVGVTEGFAVFQPFASASPAETWIVPLAHRPSFGDTDDGDLRSLAAVLVGILRRVRAAFSDPDFNYTLHSEIDGNENPAGHWSVRIAPRLTTAAGFELGARMPINVTLPAETAQALREATA